MKKKFIITAIVTGSLLFGGMVGAAIFDYVAEINEHKETEKDRLETLFDQKKQQYENEANAELSEYTQQEKLRISNELDGYVDVKTKEVVDEQSDKTKEDVKMAADKAIDELKKYVDDLAK